MEYIDVQYIRSRGNVREEVDDSLAASIAERGIMVPIIVSPADDGFYEVKDGHRRLKAALSLGMQFVPYVEVEQVEYESDYVIQQVIINNERKLIGYLDMAKTFAKLKELGMLQKEIAASFGTTSADVSLALATLEASPKLQKAVADGRLAPSAIEPLLPLPLEQQEALADTAIRLKTVRKIRDLVETEKRKSLTKSHAPEEAVESAEDGVGMLVLTALETAKNDLSMVADLPVTDAELKKRGRLAVKELLELARRLESSM
jgi:ParB family chromosome partitioning protein